MGKYLRFLHKISLAFGLDIKKMLQAIKGIPSYLTNLSSLKKQEKTAHKRFPFTEPNLCLVDRFEESGMARGHYFYQDWLVANRIYQNNPETHIDVGSRIDGFVTHVASFRTIHVIDIRPLKTTNPNIKFTQADVMSGLKEEQLACCDSLSCLHSLEHFGLGRYGDPVSYDGYIEGLKHLTRLLQTGGKFYLSVPIGPQRIEYNAHRVFALDYILRLLEVSFSIDRFSYVDDQGDLHMDIPLSLDSISNNYGCVYGCAIFEATKH